MDSFQAGYDDHVGPSMIPNMTPNMIPNMTPNMTPNMIPNMTHVTKMPRGSKQRVRGSRAEDFAEACYFDWSLRFK